MNKMNKCIFIKLLITIFFLFGTFFTLSADNSAKNIQNDSHGNLDADFYSEIANFRWSIPAKSIEENFSKASELLLKGANPNAKTNGQLPLQTTLIAKDTYLIEFLLKNGAKKELLSNDQRKVLETVTETKLFKDLLSLDLIEAVEVDNSIGTMTKLLELGADPSFENHSRPYVTSALLEAVMHLNKPYVELLLKYGAKRELLSIHGQATIDYIITGQKEYLYKAHERKIITAKDRKALSDSFISKLPNKAQKVLYKEIPDFVMWAKDDYITQPSYKNLIKTYPIIYGNADFNGDGKSDFVLCGHNTESDLIIVLLSNSNGYTTKLLSSSPLVDPLESRQKYLEVYEMIAYPDFGLQTTIMIEEHASFHSSVNKPCIDVFGSDPDHYYYIWEDGKFETFSISEGCRRTPCRDTSSNIASRCPYGTQNLSPL